MRQAAPSTSRASISPEHPDTVVAMPRTGEEERAAQAPAEATGNLPRSRRELWLRLWLPPSWFRRVGRNTFCHGRDHLGRRGDIRGTCIRDTCSTWGRAGIRPDLGVRRHWLSARQVVLPRPMAVLTQPRLLPSLGRLTVTLPGRLDVGRAPELEGMGRTARLSTVTRAANVEPIVADAAVAQPADGVLDGVTATVGLGNRCERADSHRVATRFEQYNARGANPGRSSTRGHSPEVSQKSPPCHLAQSRTTSESEEGSTLSRIIRGRP